MFSPSARDSVSLAIMNWRRWINPSVAQLGKANAVLSGTGRSYHVPEFEGCLSIKTIVAGSAVWSAGGRRFTIKENCWLILNDRQRYTLDIESQNPTTTFCLFFKRGFVEDIWRTMVTPASDLLDSLENTPGRAGFFEAIEPEDSPVLRRVQRFRHDLTSDTMDGGEWQDCFVQIGAELVATQRRALADMAKLSATKRSTRLELCKRVRRGRDLLLSCSNQRITLQELARGACMSPYHFHRTFRRFFGLTPHALLTQYRLNCAAEQLCRTHKSVTELCFEIGFESLPSFSALFRKRFGSSPREFRRAKASSSAIRKIG